MFENLKKLAGRSKRFIPLGLGLLSTFLVFSFYLNNNQLFKDVGNIIFDNYQRLQPRDYIVDEEMGPPPVRVVDIDEDSLDELGQWPWPRTQLADMTIKLVKAGAAVVVYDIVFSEPDRTSPSNIAPILLSDGLPFEQFDLISNLRDHDEYMAQAFQQTPVVTGYFLDALLPEGEEQVLPAAKAGIVELGLSAIDQLPRYQSATPTMPLIDAGAKGSGFVSVANIDGGVIRKAPLLARIDEQIYPSLSLEALRVAIGQSTIRIKSTAGSGEFDSGNQEFAFVSQIALSKDFVMPTTQTGEFIVHYTEDVPERRVPAWKIIKPGAMSVAELREKFEGHIVLVGPSAPGLLDLRSTPMNPSEPGVLIHAQMIEQMINQQFLEYPAWGDSVVGSIILFGGIAMAIVLSLLGAVSGGVITLGTLGGLFYFSWHLYTQEQLLFDPTYAIFGILFVAATTVLSKFYLTEAEKAEIRGAFDHYLSPDMVDQIADDPTLLQLGGVEKDITILFCDVRSFSKISEKLTPQELIGFLNNFLTPMTEILLDSKSTIDKYIGDAIMSFWNAPLDDPDHAANACRGSLLMIHKLWEMNDVFSDDPENAPLPVETHIGIGLNSGPCSVGNMGSTQRFAYSVLGDAVNLSSRLEGLTKQYKSHIIIGSATAAAAPYFAHYEMDQLRVVGREAPERIFMLVGDEQVAKSDNFLKLAELQAAYLSAYRNQAWDEAEAIGKEARTYAQEYRVAGYYDVMDARIAEYRKNPPGEDWDGVYAATSK